MGRDVERMKNSGEVEEIDMKPIEKFFEKVGVMLTAFSIFLFTFFNIISSDFVNVQNEYYKVSLGLLFGIILIVAVFIALVSQKFDKIVIKVFGLAVLALPIFLYIIMEESIKQSLSNGISFLLMVLTLFGGVGLMIWVFKKIEERIGELRFFYLVNGLLATGLFLLFKFTSLAGDVYRLIPRGTGWTEAIVVGLEVGISIGLVLAPALIVSNKLFPVKD